VTPLLNAGLGMDPQSTGFENIRTVGLLLGMTRAEIDARIDDIAAFCELGDFLDLPVRTYSSGMQLRLSFAIATSIDPEILLMDEGLGAGDERFAEKAAARVDALIERTNVLVFASHAEPLIRQMCNKAVLLDNGLVRAIGPIDDVFDFYRHFVHEKH
jgi:ABC-type polysaccharide/polyol phosphate transport system ATPase subunit